jgi:hypothetical protein
MTWAIDAADVDLALRHLCSVPWTTYMQAGHGFELAAVPVLALPGASDHPDYPLGLATAADQAAIHGDAGIAAQLAEEAEAAERRLGSRADGLVGEYVGSSRVIVAMARGSWHEAAVGGVRCAEIARRAGRLADAATQLSGAAAMYGFAGDADAAIPLATEALALARGLGVPGLMIGCLSSLAGSLAERDPSRAHALLEESLQLSRETHYESTTHVTQSTLVAARLRDQHLTLSLAARAVPALHWDNNRSQLAGVLNVVAWAAAIRKPEAAAAIQGAARRLALGAVEDGGPTEEQPELRRDERPGTGPGLIIGLRRECTRQLATSLGQDRLAELRALGEATDIDEVVRRTVALIEDLLDVLASVQPIGQPTAREWEDRRA